MTYTLLDLNILKGRYLDRIISSVKNNHFEICTFQEVTGGLASYDNKLDCFNYLEQALDLKGELGISFRLKQDPRSYFGNATFFSQKFIFEKKEVLYLKPYRAIEENYPNNDLRWSDTPYSALVVKLQCHKPFFVVNTHGVWSPIAKDTPEKLRQAKILYGKLRKLKDPFILAGDFNMVRDTQVIDLYELIAINLTKKFHVENTLNPRLHYSKNELPHGLAVDHIFVSPGIKVKKFEVLKDLDLSDHLPLRLEFEI